ncbi:MAG: hypothetical protein AAF485_05200 [Chloroflexota bacterium]
MTDRLGHRKIFGVLIPGMNSVVEPELAMLRVAGVTNQTARHVIAPGLKTPGIEAVMELLLTCSPDALLLGLTTESAEDGLITLAALAEDLAKKSGLPVFSGSFASYAALRTMGATKIAVVTPFDDAKNAELVQPQVESQGFEVVSIAGTAAPSLEAIAGASTEEIRGVFESANHPEAEAILQLGTALPIVDLVAGLEVMMDKPIVACNAALYWQALRENGITDTIEGFGRLLKDY